MKTKATFAGWWFGTWTLWLSIYWECHHPNWRSPSFFRGVGLNHQPVRKKVQYFRLVTPESPRSDQRSGGSCWAALSPCLACDTRSRWPEGDGFRGKCPARWCEKSPNRCWWFGTSILFFHILRINNPDWIFFFQRVWEHQPYIINAPLNRPNLWRCPTPNGYHSDHKSSEQL